MKCASLKHKHIFSAINECKHKNNIKRLWCKIVFQNAIEHIESNGGIVFIYTPLGI
jgi:hypothetical protein